MENDFQINYCGCKHEECFEQAWSNPFELTPCEELERHFEARGLIRQFHDKKISYEEYALQIKNRNLHRLIMTYSKL